MQHRILVIENDYIPVASSAHAALRSEPSFQCARVSWQDFAQALLGAADAELVVAVASDDSSDVAPSLESLARHRLAIPLLAVLSDSAGPSLFELAARVADDFVIAPLRQLEMRSRVDRMLSTPRSEVEVVRDTLIAEMTFANLVGRAPVFLQAMQHVPRFARADMPVLITGETGTGKELCARALHQLGRRRECPFVPVDCGAIPEQLFENELFGHARGAFTGADREHKGLIAMAEGGTLFLDEIDALSVPAQAKLLRFLQEQTYRPLGSERTRSADIKIVAATNRDLRTCVDEKRFRADLFFRINVLHVHLPPLRERTGDVELLAQSLLARVGSALEGRPRSFTRAALRALSGYHWPGNIRELNNVVQRAAVRSEGESILPQHVVLPSQLADAAPSRPSGEFRTARAAAVAAFERHYVEELLRKHGGNVTRAAREASQDRRAFGRFIKKYNIDKTGL